MDYETVLSIVGKHYPNRRVVRHEDLSTGCDNWIYCITFAKSDDNMLDIGSDKVVVRLPRKLSQPDCPQMHWPRLQAHVLHIMDRHSIPAPKLLTLGSNYLIETYLPEIDLSKVEDLIRKEQSVDHSLKDIFSDIGFYVKRIHSIDCCKRFGYIVAIDASDDRRLVGKYHNWYEVFENDLSNSLLICSDRQLIDQNVYKTIEQMLSDLTPYLKTFSSPKLLHSDICGNNIRVVRRVGNSENSYQFNGFIDFADCMAGDPMWDLGELLLSYYGDYDIIKWFECGYGLLSSEQLVLIRFYAICYNICVLSISETTESVDKWSQTLKKLLN